MCGFAGKLVPSTHRPVDRDLIRAMTDCVAHRGPDADGFFFGAAIGLGHRRLSIVDVASGNQPLANEDGTVWVVFNGEIYNFPALRAELEGRGHHFRTHSDTEVIVHGYEEWGERCVERFRGMFAFAIWDARARRLLLARDRVGIKPLYYAQPAEGGLVFGVRDQVDSPGSCGRRRVEPGGARRVPHAPLCAGSGNDLSAGEEAPAGSRPRSRTGHVRVSQYRDLEFTGTGDPANEQQYLEELDALLTESVRHAAHQRGSARCVPLGRDRLVDGRRLHDRDERRCPFSRPRSALPTRRSTSSIRPQRIADHLGCRLEKQLVAPRVDELLPRLAWHLDEPFGDSSAVPTYLVSAAARERVTVALSGDGGDELWAGYPWHRVEHWEWQARERLGRTGCDLASRLGNLLPLSAKGARSLRHLGLPPGHACARKHGYAQFDDTAKQQLYSGDLRVGGPWVRSVRNVPRAYAACQSPDPLDRSMYVDVKTYLADDILAKVDKMSMAVSLEARVPLLDHKLLEFAAPRSFVAQAPSWRQQVPASPGARTGAFRARFSTAPSTASRRRSASGFADRSRLWQRSCCWTVG